MNLWNKYKNTIIKNCINPLENEGDLTYWRNHLFATTLVYLIPLIGLLVIPTFIYCYLEKFYLLIFFNLKTFILTALLALLPSINITYRKTAFFFLAYVHSIILLIYLGDEGAALLFILALSIFFIIIFPNKYAFGPIYLSILLGLVFTLLIEYDLKILHVSLKGKAFKWVILNLHLTILITIFSMLLPRLFVNMQTAIDKQKSLQLDLNTKNCELLESEEKLRKLNFELESRVLKRTKDLEEAYQHLETFSYSISHDLQTPIRAINVFTLALEKETKDNLSSDAETYLRKIIGSTKKMSDLIENLLKFSKINMQGIRKNEISIAALTNAIWENLTQQNKKDIEFILHQLPLVEGDGILIQQVIENLLSNALKYSSNNQNQKIEVGINEDNVFYVKDNGIGFNMNNHDRIFKIFKRLHTDNEFIGTGVGLSIVKVIIEKHGGKVWAESEIGNGSTFYFTLP